MTDRNVLDVTPKVRRGETRVLRPFSDFSECRNIVLLGDAGAGKTHLLSEAAELNGGLYVKARSFLLVPTFPENASLFIDGLDETRAGRSDQDTINTFVKRLFEIRPSKVRISCRVADWLGDTDLAAFDTYFQGHGNVTVLSLHALTQAEQEQIIIAKRFDGQQEASREVLGFLQEAISRGLQEFTLNPQNLLMLWDAVKREGVWPRTRRQLFELSARLLLSESNRDHQRFGSGVFTGNELRASAGAICAARLISDVEGISLQEQGDGPDFPSYRSLQFLEPEKAQASLGRPIFTAGPKPESFDYTHRTTAEYVAAGWIAEQIRAGLSVGRCLAIMGVDGHPASELRGLHAWLAVLSPDNADRLIVADPYGVLTYGDAASLSSSSRKHLLAALARLSEQDPWFRSENWGSPALGMLAQSDTVDEFRAILNSPTSNFGLRSLVIDALASGTPLPDMLQDLATVIDREQSPFLERIHAAFAIEKLGQRGQNALAKFCKNSKSRSDSSIRLRAEIISDRFESDCGAEDVRQLFVDAANCETRLASGALWRVGEAVPPNLLPSFLNVVFASPDGFSDSHQDTEVRRWNLSQVWRTIDRLLLRCLQTASYEGLAADVLEWLRCRSIFAENNVGFYRKEIAAELRSSLLLTREITERYFDSLSDDETDFSHWYQFESLVMGAVAPQNLSEWLATCSARATPGTKKERLLFEMALTLCWTDAPWASRRFEKLSEFARARPDLRAAYEERVSMEIPEWRRKQTERDIARNEQNARDLAKTLKDFATEADSIRLGQRRDWLDWAADIYFAEWDEIDSSLSPRVRLDAILGQDYAAAVLEGFIAFVRSEEPLTPSQVAKIGVAGQRKIGWRALLAGIEEVWSANPDLGAFSDEFWRSAISVQLFSPVFERTEKSQREKQPDWRQALLNERPELVSSTYEEIARTCLASPRAEHQPISGLHQLLYEPSLKMFSEQAAIALLTEFPFPPSYALRSMLDCVLPAPSCHAELLQIVRKALLQRAENEPNLRDRWLVTGYLIAPEEFNTQVVARFAVEPGLAWVFRDLTGSEHGRVPRLPLSIQQAESIAGWVGAHFKESGYPTGVMNGNTNAWDAADFVHSLINRISASPDAAASEAIARLNADDRLISYRNFVSHALASQSIRRREKEYRRPNWDETVGALANAAPANVADLTALTLAMLQDANVHIRSSSTDIYKQFWNVDSYGRPLEPRPEETCRDALLTLLRPRLRPHGVNPEPEGHMADDKRADIVVLGPGMKVVVELKKDSHSDVWTAAYSQLDRLYTRDPDASGFGIYGVFWFGPNRRKNMPAPPAAQIPPATAAQMESMLRASIPENVRARISVVVIDVSDVST